MAVTAASYLAPVYLGPELGHSNLQPENLHTTVLDGQSIYSILLTCKNGSSLAFSNTPLNIQFVGKIRSPISLAN